jgi:hypothetical protein
MLANMMKRALLLVGVVACGGGNTSTQTTTPPTSSASATTPAPTESQATQSPPPDNSPESIGNRHKKVGNGWFISAGGKDFYDAIYEPGSEPIVVLKQNGTNPNGKWVTLMKNVGAAPYAGKKIRIRLGVKTSGMSSNMTRAELWARAAVPHQAEDAPSIKAPLDKNAEMKTYEVTIDVKDNARVIEYGASIAGDGELRVGRDTIDVL